MIRESTEGAHAGPWTPIAIAMVSFLPIDAFQRAETMFDTAASRIATTLDILAKDGVGNAAPA